MSSPHASLETLDRELRSRLEEAYDFRALLSQGIPARVYRAWDKKLGRDVVIKVLDQPTDEAWIQAKLNHPNVAQIYQVMQHGEQLALVLEHIEGKSFAPTSPGEIMAFEDWLPKAQALMEALHVIHEAGIVHGDIAPQNVMLTHDGTVKLIDFGLASHLEDKVLDSATRIYASPERHRGEAALSAGDLFAFGIVVYRVLSGQHPFAGPVGTDSTEQITANILKNRWTPIVEHLGARFAPFDTLFAKLLAPRPQRRPSAAQALHELRALGRSLVSETGDRTELIHTVQAPFRLWPWVVGAVVLISLAAGYAYHALRQPLTPELVLVIPDDPPEESRALLATAGAIHGLHETIIAHPAVNLLPTYTDDSADAGRRGVRAGADLVITLEQSCTVELCDLTLQLLRPPGWAVEKTGSLRVPLDATISVRTLATRAAQELLGLSPTTPSSVGISEADYQTFLNAYQHNLYHQGLSLENWQHMAELLRREPYFQASYSLFRELSLNLHHDQNDPVYLETLAAVLASAPAAYQESEAFNIDQFWLALARNDLDAAQQRLVDSEARGLTRSNALDMRAELALEAGDIEAAITAYELALSIHPSINLRYNLARAHWFAGANPKAVELLNTNLRVAPDDADSAELLGNIHLLGGDLPRAIEVYNAQLAYTRPAMIVMNLAVAHMLAGNFEDALAFAKEAVEQSAQGPAQLLNLADALYLNGDEESAFARYAQVLQSTANETGLENLLLHAQAYAHLGNSGAALDALQAALNTAPDNPQAQLVGALVHTELGNVSAGNFHIDRALTLGAGTVWLNLPWFTTLCHTREFVDLTRRYDRGDRCLVLPAGNS
ncbi:MAG: protein kinase [Pseudomonadota bacterium]